VLHVFSVEEGMNIRITFAIQKVLNITSIEMVVMVQKEDLEPQFGANSNSRKIIDSIHGLALKFQQAPNQVVCSVERCLFVICIPTLSVPHSI
jgi:hypothetical protein